MITPRTTRLVRVHDLAAFRAALAMLACDGPPLAARDRLVVVPTRAAAEHLQRSIESRLLPERGSLVLPDFVPAPELIATLAQRLDELPVVLGAAEREAILGAACRATQAAGVEPPFRVRPGLIGEMLRFYDELRRNQKTLDTFERLTLGLLEPGALNDRGAERLVRQTLFLVAAFREFERRSNAAGADLHVLQRRLIEQPARRPYRHVVLAVADRAYDPNGLGPSEWDLLARIPGLERLDVVATDRTVAGAFHELVHQLLPGIEEVRMDPASPPTRPVLRVPPEGLVHRPRDREDEVADFVRRIKGAVRAGDLSSPSRAALVVHQRLPYVYVAREVCRAAGVPCQMFDALPLAAEPYAAVVDIVLSVVASNFARTPSVALLVSPHLRIGGDARPRPRDVAALDRALAEVSYLGDPVVLARLADGWAATEDSGGEHRRQERLASVARVLLAVAAELAPLQAPQPASAHLRTLIAFLDAYDLVPGPDDPLRARQLRARAAVVGTLASLADAFERFDQEPVPFADVRALVRRWLDAHTFAPRTGEAGVHIVDSASARFGDFDIVQLAGLVEGEWPQPPTRSIFYSTNVLRELGWPSEPDRIAGVRAAFTDLITLPATAVLASSALLEADTHITPSPFIDELAATGLDTVEDVVPSGRMFDHEALAIGTPRRDVVDGDAAQWLALRLDEPAGIGPEYRGSAGPYDPSALSLSAIERYVDCPFKFFAAHVLRLEEPPDDSPGSPKARGRFVHEALQRFFEAWDRSGNGPIAPDNLGAARAVFAEAVEPLLAAMSDTDAAIERTRLFGSAISAGIVETLLALEAARRPEAVTERWLEYRLEGEFSLGEPGLRVPLRGVADRIDLLPGRRLRVVDYKSGSAPQPKLALQAPVYALCAQERLSERDGAPWEIDEASYLAFSGARTNVSSVKAGGSDAVTKLGDARERVLAVVAGVRSGAFPPRPLDEMSCRFCAYASVCRKDYVGDE